MEIKGYWYILVSYAVFFFTFYKNFSLLRSLVCSLQTNEKCLLYNFEIK